MMLKRGFRVSLPRSMRPRPSLRTSAGLQSYQQHEPSALLRDFDIGAPTTDWSIGSSSLAERTNKQAEVLQAVAPTRCSLSRTGLEIHRAAPAPLPELEGMPFGAHFTDHMLEVDWTAEHGWGTPRIVPFHNLSLHPAAHALHYAVEIFEGMKAYHTEDGGAQLFRPVDNMVRMNLSAKRLCLPSFDPLEMAALMQKFVEVESRWVPPAIGHSLYVRPTLISLQDRIALGKTEKALFYAIASPVGPYFPTGFKSVRLLATTKYTRAPHGGTGDAKCGGNYGGTIRPEGEAREAGCAQNLWLLGDDHDAYVTEAGTMNFFVLWRESKTGPLELVTPPLDGTILPGITRDTVLRLAPMVWPGLRVVERKFTISDICEASNEGRIVEAFGTGTACVLCPIEAIRYHGRDYAIPTGVERAGKKAQAGELTQKLTSVILDIQHGRRAPPPGLEHWTVPVAPPHDEAQADGEWISDGIKQYA